MRGGGGGRPSQGRNGDEEVRGGERDERGRPQSPPPTRPSPPLTSSRSTRPPPHLPTPLRPAVAPGLLTQPQWWCRRQMMPLLPMLQPDAACSCACYCHLSGLSRAAEGGGNPASPRAGAGCCTGMGAGRVGGQQVHTGSSRWQIVALGAEERGRGGRGGAAGSYRRMGWQQVRGSGGGV